jgi:hypothetical protein
MFYPPGADAVNVNRLNEDDMRRAMISFLPLRKPHPRKTSIGKERGVTERGRSSE